MTEPMYPKTLRIGIVIWLSTLSNATFSQTFEGKIVYKISIESANPKSISQDNIEMMFNGLDTVAVLFLRESYYKFITLDSRTNLPRRVNQYDPISNRHCSYSLSVNDSTPEMIVNENFIIPIEVIESKSDDIIVLEKKCTSITINYGFSKAQIYFSSDFKLDTNKFRKDAPGFIQYINVCGALPLKIILSGNGAVHNLIFTAKEIIEVKLDSTIFKMPNE